MHVNSKTSQKSVERPRYKGLGIEVGDVRMIPHSMSPSLGASENSKKIVKVVTECQENVWYIIRIKH